MTAKLEYRENCRLVEWERNVNEKWHKWAPCTLHIVFFASQPVIYHFNPPTLPYIELNWCRGSFLKLNRVEVHTNIMCSIPNVKIVQKELKVLNFWMNEDCILFGCCLAVIHYTPVNYESVVTCQMRLLPWNVLLLSTVFLSNKWLPHFIQEKNSYLL